MYRHLTRSLVFGLALASTACGGGAQTYQVVGSQRDPGAQGRIQVELIEGGNHMVTATLEHMTPPERLGSGLTTFLMWFRTPQGQSTMESRIEYDPETRTGRAYATTPQNNFVVIVTAERNPNATSPSENVIFTQRVAAD